jgi:IclR family transcriptional regulator, KDG regulon repressor
MVQSVDRAISILKCFNERKRELKLSEISDELGLNKSTVHGIINTLKKHGLIEQDEKTQKYRLGLYLIGLGELVVSSIDVRAIGYPIIEEVCQVLEETVHAVVLDCNDVVYIDKKECDNSVRISTKIGSRSPSFCTADGKVMLAYLDLKKQNIIIPDDIPKFTPNTITDKNEIIKELAVTKDRGYAIDNEQYETGLVCVAAPVFDHSGAVKYAISVTGPSLRMTQEKITESIKVLKDAAYKISYEIGYRK